eukprot:CAMPEP_0174827138 /NCGR_PEP_ID=MMETSP1114-20130205/516_1 /TAXON_ID=312471 /ORGANISM="Neobodo designis, Strain CCAP 1951/1" /LENGTH=128 /DNA_ID=CAMNT_0016060745 /DNA_START=394 /DNA_END=776 /DNA_ORIENTATION=+
MVAAGASRRRGREMMLHGQSRVVHESRGDGRSDVDDDPRGVDVAVHENDSLVLRRVGGREPAVPEREDHGGQHSRQESETKHRHQRAAEHVVRGLRGRLVAGRVVRLAARLLSAVLGAPGVVAVVPRV